MPIIIKENETEWSESEDKIVVIVPLTSRIDTNPSVLVTTKYVKISSPPYIWECFLYSSIDSENSFVRIGKDQVSFEAKKVEKGLWNKLSHQNAGCESYCKEQRTTALEEYQRSLENSTKLKSQKYQEIRQESVRKQMELDDSERKSIEHQKLLENQRAALEIKRKKEQLKAKMNAQKRKNILEKCQQIPPTRKSGHITVNFTPRVFPTAARESQEIEEKEWLEKQFAASVSLKLDCSELTPEQRNPEWLKAKAESMFKKGDFKSAINAYNLAIRMCPNLYSLYLGRSDCHLQLRHLHKAIEDSSKALELLVPAVPSNAGARKKAHKVRGMAFVELKLPVEGLMDIEAALKLPGTDDEMQKYACELRYKIESEL
ncbi:hypothetical protein JTE90_016053 [Oedothorax gibbosus]|uniref:CS domain-containing protein n=1 Tax=Oedothorax gibbosus TaxID=931172 RepID=A0AAV6U4M6_9ARAC|nr:hypothetical protein JTE90_016053 [Oedothorax gibbosus]